MILIFICFLFNYYDFQIERELVVTTSEKIAEVGRIEKQLNAADNNTKNQSEPEAGTNMQAIVTQSAWGEDRRGVRKN
jgi:hypothetical protein